MNRNSSQENQDDSQSLNQEKLDVDSSGSKTPKKITDSANTNSILKLTQIRSRKNTPTHKEMIGQCEVKSQFVPKEESKKNKDFYFVNYVSSIEKSHSSSAIEGKCLKKLVERQNSGDMDFQQQVFGFKNFSTTEDLPRVFSNNKNPENFEGIFNELNFSDSFRRWKN